jgi:hypothetical protein
VESAENGCTACAIVDAAFEAGRCDEVVVHVVF